MDGNVAFLAPCAGCFCFLQLGKDLPRMSVNDVAVVLRVDEEYGTSCMLWARVVTNADEPGYG